MEEPIKVIFHLGSGQSVNAIWESEEEVATREEALDVLEAELETHLQRKPSWFCCGDLWVFTGAVSAIEIDY